MLRVDSVRSWFIESWFNFVCLNYRYFIPENNLTFFFFLTWFPFNLSHSSPTVPERLVGSLAPNQVRVSSPCIMDVGQSEVSRGWFLKKSFRTYQKWLKILTYSSCQRLVGGWPSATSLTALTRTSFSVKSAVPLIINLLIQTVTLIMDIQISASQGIFSLISE